MADLYIKLTNLAVDAKKPWKLILRDHGPAETDTFTIAFLSFDVAKLLVDYRLADWWDIKDYEKVVNPQKTKIEELENQLKLKTEEITWLKQIINKQSEDFETDVVKKEMPVANKD